MKYELGGKTMTEFTALRPKICSFLADDSDENENTKDKKSVP